MTLALIITTYNRPDALNLVLQSALNQSRMPDEIAIADDGSDDRTKAVIQNWASVSKIPIHHAWHPDENFRAATARNRAVAMTQSEYLVMIDGDILLHPRFVEDHLKAAEDKTFVQSGRVLLGPKATRKAIERQQLNFDFFSFDISNRKNALRSPFLSKIFSKKNKSIKGIRTCNFALFRKDLLAVNGFDNRFIGWGREDSEFAARLLNNGLKRKDIKFSAITYHLYHSENSKSSLAHNDRLLQQTMTQNSTYTPNGIKELS